MSVVRTQGQLALADWLRRHGKAGFDALWRACGWGRITVLAIEDGEILPDDSLSEALGEVTQGMVTIAMFATPAPIDPGEAAIGDMIEMRLTTLPAEDAR